MCILVHGLYITFGDVLLVLKSSKAFLLIQSIQVIAIQMKTYCQIRCMLILLDIGIELEKP